MNKRIHFIGICGVAMSALAIAMYKKGWQVSGSDAGFYPPISTHLKKYKINFYPGWHPKKMIEDGVPDIVVVGNVASSNNPEWLYVQEHNIEHKSYPQLVADFFVKKNSIVCAGTYGKTSSSTLLTWILESAAMDPSYMFGGISLNLPESARLTESIWSILEGDEYKTARWDNGPKFRLYSPTHLLLTSVIWDHADVYPTEESYFQTFGKLLHMVPEDGLMVVCLDNSGVRKLIADEKRDIVTYGEHESADYRYINFSQTKNGISLTIIHNETRYEISAPVLGKHMAENICGCFAMAHQIGVNTDKIISSLKKFKGIKRRLEIRYAGEITVIDDIAHSPTKVKTVLDTLRNLYDGKIYIVFEPNTGNREHEALPGYNYAFAKADEVIIPRLTKLKKRSNAADQPIDGEKLTQIISETHDTVSYIDDDSALINHLIQKTTTGDVIVFCGSHGFRGMIEQVVSVVSS